MKLRILPIIIAALVGLVVSLVVPAAAPQLASRAEAAGWRSCAVRLDGIRTKVAARQRTVTIVNQTSRTYARVSFWVRREHRACSFDRKFLTRTARIGYGGTVVGTKRRQSTGTTPLGTYTMTEAFGNGPAPGMWLPYHRVRKGDYWVEDNASRYYNTLRNRSQGGFRWSLPSSSRNGSEYLPHYRDQYRYAVVINFNRPPGAIRYRGAGIFLHVKSSGPTAGCVGITRRQMRIVMAYLKPGDKITIAR
ncbi:hypothetical protein GCM10009841_07330 [Microlunatus panaciterrae]|uniref:L,D-peptidoglycan transpeptidase YkuD (ErfK/YbiS/YcfS/YnhG family) n=1 Tax=Microlunatus panaciterrae TaxID=400768 RepID=A0ABS2RHZ3_9ACTN|nr:L,D-transpeptidase family protein [Microlunatus panaciterrae]MBM7798613.1 L,D-peptidoglycan transpeptidase YkuD (ErfK/YbiS/YcfS/YnhG family) [Microlunatus panaciterrae]